MCILPRESATNLLFPLCTVLAQQVFSEYLGNIKLLLVLQDFSDKYFGERAGRTKDVEDTTRPRAGETSGETFRYSRFQGEYPSHSHGHISQARVAQRGLRVSTAGSCPSSATAWMSGCGQVSHNLSVLCYFFPL